MAKKRKTTKKGTDKNIIRTIGWYLSVQATLLVLFYGFKISMPFWVVWFPSILYGIFLLIILITFLIIISKKSKR